MTERYRLYRAIGRVCFGFGIVVTTLSWIEGWLPWGSLIGGILIGFGAGGWE